MFGQVVVEAGGVSVAECSHLAIEPAVFLAGQAWDLKGMVEAILVQGLLAVQLRSPAQRQNEILFDAPEVVFSLGISKTEDSASVGSAENVGHAVGVAVDCYGSGELVWVKLGRV